MPPLVHYQKCGVMLLDLSPVMRVQADLFDTRDRSREAWLMRGPWMPSIPITVRARSVSAIPEGAAGAWAMRQAFRSPRYTTNWKELPVVR